MQTIVGSSLGFNANIGAFISNLQTTASSGDPGLSVHIAGPAASAADQVKIFKGIDTTLLYATLAVVIVLLLLTYRSPVLWLLPIISAGVSLTAAQAVIYLLTKHGLMVNGQSGGHPGGAGAGREHGLRAAAHRPLPRGAAPARGPARGDGDRAAPGRPGHHRQRA